MDHYFHKETMLDISGTSKAGIFLHVYYSKLYIPVTFMLKYRIGTGISQLT